MTDLTHDEAEWLDYLHQRLEEAIADYNGWEITYWEKRIADYFEELAS